MTINEYIPVPESDYPLWTPVTDPKWLPGYEVSYSGEVRSPQGKLLKTNRQGKNLWVFLRRADGSISSSRLDKLILMAFHGPAPEGQDVIVHKDADRDNCSIFNLVWGTGDFNWDAVPSPDEYPQTPDESLDRSVMAALKLLDLADISIDGMGFTVRTYNILRRYHIDTAEDLSLLTADDLLQMNGGGQKFLSEIKERLAMLRLALAEPTELEKQNGPWSLGHPDHPRKKRRTRKAKPVAPKGGSEVEVHRVYKLGSLQLTVNERGLGELSKKSRLTTTDMATLAELLQRAVEMNRIMGLK